jgi:hypothetical protein
VNFTPLPLYPRGKDPPYSLARRLVRPGSRCGRCGEEKTLDPIGSRTVTPRSFSPYPVAVPAPLYTRCSRRKGQYSGRPKYRSFYAKKCLHPLPYTSSWSHLDRRDHSRNKETTSPSSVVRVENLFFFGWHHKEYCFSPLMIPMEIHLWC